MIFILGRGRAALIEQIGFIAEFVGDYLVRFVIRDGEEIRRFVGDKFFGEEVSVGVVGGGVNAALGVCGEDCAGCYHGEQDGEGDWQLHGFVIL